MQKLGESYNELFDGNENPDFSFGTQVRDLFNSDLNKPEAKLHIERLKFYCMSLIFKADDFRFFYHVFDVLSNEIFEGKLSLDIFLGESVASLDTVHDEISRCIGGVDLVDSVNIKDTAIARSSYEELKYDDYFTFRINFDINNDNKVIQRLLFEIVQELKLKLSKLIKVRKIVGKYYVNQLTGIGNRTYVDLLANHYFETGDELSIFYIDLNEFKKVNDTYGHDNGDIILQQFAFLLKSELNKYSAAPGNYGGDEFVALLPGIGKEASKQIAKDIIDKFRSTTYSYKDQVFSVTVCIGISTREKGKNGNLTVKDYLKGADNALAEAKKGDKNNGSLYHIGEIVPEDKLSSSDGIYEEITICSAEQRIFYLKTIIKHIGEQILKGNDPLKGKHPREIFGLHKSDLEIIKTKKLANKKVYEILEKKFEI